jgi:hypothetical protein
VVRHRRLGVVLDKRRLTIDQLAGALHQVLDNKMCGNFLLIIFQFKLYKFSSDFFKKLFFSDFFEYLKKIFIF